MREVAAFAPYEFIEILTNTRTYGGGGIFGLYSTVAADSEQAPYVFVHEFGTSLRGPRRRVLHVAGRLRAGAGVSRVEPWEPNVTALLDPTDAQVARPGRAGHAAADAVAEGGVREGVARVSGAARQDSRRRIGPKRRWRRSSARAARSKSQLFAKEKYRGKVGAFEGANYEAKGYFRPEVDCIMFTRSPAFCAVCRRAIETVIALYTADQPGTHLPEPASTRSWITRSPLYVRCRVRLSLLVEEVEHRSGDSGTTTSMWLPPGTSI